MEKLTKTDYRSPQARVFQLSTGICLNTSGGNESFVPGSNGQW